MSKILYTFFIFSSLVSYSQPIEELEKGYVMMIGGGISEDHAQLFKKLAGGEKSKILVIPSAMDQDDLNRDSGYAKIKTRFLKLGFGEVTIVHPQSKTEANNRNFCKVIESATGVFFLGGNTNRLALLFRNTLLQESLKSLLGRGGIIAGTSAGSGIQCSYFHEGQLMPGFKWVEGLVVMNHFTTKDKLFTHTEDIKNSGKRLALGIDDGTAILVHKNTFEVVGSSYVAVFDGSYFNRMEDSVFTLPDNSNQFYLLQNNDRYNLAEFRIENTSRIKPIILKENDFRKFEGFYQSKRNNFFIQIRLDQGMLKLQNSWGWEEYPIYPYSSRTFFAVNRNMWFRFKLDPITNEVISVEKMRSVLQEKTINELFKVD